MRAQGGWWLRRASKSGVCSGLSSRDQVSTPRAGSHVDNYVRLGGVGHCSLEVAVVLYTTSFAAARPYLCAVEPAFQPHAPCLPLNLHHPHTVLGRHCRGERGSPSCGLPHPTPPADRGVLLSIWLGPLGYSVQLPWAERHTGGGASSWVRSNQVSPVRPGQVSEPWASVPRSA